MSTHHRVYLSPVTRRHACSHPHVSPAPLLINLTLLMTLPRPGLAQDGDSGGIFGRITDTHGLGIANVGVTIESTSSPESHRTRTAIEGSYAIPRVSSGSYEIIPHGAAIQRGPSNHNIATALGGPIRRHAQHCQLRADRSGDSGTVAACQSARAIYLSFWRNRTPRCTTNTARYCAAGARSNRYRTNRWPDRN